MLKSYNSQALDCNQMYSKVSQWVSLRLMLGEKKETFKVGPGMTTTTKKENALNPKIQRKRQATSTCITTV